MDLYCKVFVNVDLSGDQFFEWLLEKYPGESDVRTLSTSLFEMDVISNEDFDKKKQNDFIYYPYYLEIDAVDSLNEEQYVSEIGGLLESLWLIGADAVAASDFEDKLPKKG